MWTFTIDDTDGDGVIKSNLPSAKLEETKTAAYEAMCAIFDGPLPEVEEDGKQYVPPAAWETKERHYEWDVYRDRTFVVRVFIAGEII